MRPDGTIDRSNAPAIVNPCDLHALEAARTLTSDVVAVTMGPPGAEAALREAIAHGAAEGVLVTDRAFAGSDTWATANVLAAAIRKLCSFDVILCGLPAIDGETGQVGPHVAQRLGIPQATGCESIRVTEDRLLVRRIIEGGYEIASLPMPALLTIAETGYAPAYPTLPLRRRAARATLISLGAADLALEPDQYGLEASPTKVAHMKSVGLPHADTEFVGDHLTYADLAAHIRERTDGSTAREALPVDTTGLPVVAPTHGDLAVMVVAEADSGGISAGTAELLTKGRSLADELGGTLAAFIAGTELGPAATELALFGPDRIFTAEDERLAPYATLPHSRVLHDAIAHHTPDTVLLNATSVGRDLAPRVAAMLDTGLAADCTDLHIADWSRRKKTYPDLLHQVRPAMGSSVLATCISPETRPQMATVRPGTFRARLQPRRAAIEPVAVDLHPTDLVVDTVEIAVAASDVRLVDADVIVAGGAGCTKDNWHLVEALASQLEGRVAASRAAVDSGLADRALQVGQTGQTVAPKLYIACGISGALQHTVGMRSAATVLAINRDPEAPIFTMAHYGIVGDVTDVLPRLTEALA